MNRANSFPGRGSGGSDHRLCDDYAVNRQTGSQLLSMMALVAAVVAIVILVFFGIGYLFGRMFL